MQALAVRRDDGNIMRRRGTGRETTKRSFAIGLVVPAQNLVGRRTGLPLKQQGRRDSHELDNVQDFWRDSVDSETGASEPVQPTPFKRRETLVRTPGEAGHEVAPAPVWGAEPPVAPESRSIATSPPQFADGGRHRLRSLEEAPPTHMSTGTSPPAPPPPPPPADSPAHSSGEFDDSMEADNGFGGDASDDDAMGAAPASLTPAAERGIDFDDSDRDAGFDDGDGGFEPAEEEVPPPPPPPPTAPKPKRKPRSTKRKTSLEKLGTVVAPAITGEGGNGKRQRFRPLEYWRNERVVYGRRDSAKFAAIIDVQVAERERTPVGFRAPKRGKKAEADALANATDLLVPYAAAVSDDDDAPLTLRGPSKKAKKARKAKA